MLDEVDRLPGAERQPRVQHRNLKRHRGQHRADMRGHVVRAFGVVDPAAVLGRQPIQRGGEIDPHRRIGIFLNRQRRRRVAAEEAENANANANATKK